MKRHQQFYLCKHCGNLVGMINNAGVPLICCGESMLELIPNTEEASQEKHLPVASVEGDRLVAKVGSADHPMEEKHYIEWIYLETEKGGQRKNLLPGEKPAVSFALVDDKPLAVFAYCNIHGLWKTELA
ncbi:MAG: desulfoferrodoxin [Clostridiales bacterium]|nr:desulfoferrodoxin [Clostridiales bacterium]